MAHWIPNRELKHQWQRKGMAINQIWANSSETGVLYLCLNFSGRLLYILHIIVCSFSREILVCGILRRRLQKMSSSMRSSRKFLATPLLHMTKSCETSTQISSAIRILLETLVPHKAFKCLLYLLSEVLFFYTRVVWEHVYMAGFCIYFCCYFHHKYTKSFFISF